MQFMNNQHPCEIIYGLGADGKIYGDQQGMCRITGKPSKGLCFRKWVKDTFTNFDDLQPGDIISNEALFCFDEKSEVLKRLQKRDKLQKFRTYSHFVHQGMWHPITKANKVQMYKMLISEEQPTIAVMSDSGQTHLLFKHRIGFWQLEHAQIAPDVPLLQHLMSEMQELLMLGFSQTEIIEGNYKPHRIHKAGVKQWALHEENIKQHRGSGIFDVTAWLLHQPENTSANEDKRRDSGELNIPAFSLFG